MQVIHLDNSEFFRRLMRFFLIKKGVESKSFEEANQALDIIKNDKNVIVIAGTYFAGMSLIDFVKEIRALPYYVPILILTSGTASEDQHDLIQNIDVDAYIEKTGSWETSTAFYLDKWIEKLESNSNSSPV
ncbi:MAG: response regulator [Spirochaetaceae bacterium]|jgi:DNA-binding response OmpR family regulator|nr:response regulator [Spirochaetaceae bacterium]